MIKQGIVMNIHHKNAYIMTNDGQFLKVKIENKMPSIGEIFKGKVVTNSSIFFKYSSIAASIFFALVILPFIALYFKAVTTVSININPHINLQANKWNIIVKASPLNTDGEEILKNINLNNKTIDDGLSLIVEEAKKDNYINEEYIKSNKEISVQISSKNNLEVDLSEFKQKAEKEDLNVYIKPIKNENSEGNINIIVDKEKFTEVKIESNTHPKHQDKNNNKTTKQQKPNNDKSDINNKNNIDNNETIDKNQNLDKIQQDYKTDKEKGNTINNNTAEIKSENKTDNSNSKNYDEDDNDDVESNHDDDDENDEDEDEDDDDDDDNKNKRHKNHSLNHKNLESYHKYAHSLTTKNSSKNKYNNANTNYSVGTKDNKTSCIYNQKKYYNAKNPKETNNIKKIIEQKLDKESMRKLNKYILKFKENQHKRKKQYN